MIDCAIGLAGLCMVIFSPIALAVRPGVNRPVGNAFVLGFIPIGGSLGTILYPEEPFGGFFPDPTAHVSHVD
jgi:hypothetical protein